LIVEDPGMAITHRYCDADADSVRDNDVSSAVGDPVLLHRYMNPLSPPRCPDLFMPGFRAAFKFLHVLAHHPKLKICPSHSDIEANSVSGEVHLGLISTAPWKDGGETTMEYVGFRWYGFG
jgi:hypothetical protein